MINYSLRLNESGLKATPQRIAILEMIEILGHADIDTIYERLKKRFTSLSLATIYKNMAILGASKIIKELAVPYKKVHYEVAKSEHSHHVCNKCGKIEDIAIDLSKILSGSFGDEAYRIEEATLFLSGSCGRCR